MGMQLQNAVDSLDEFEDGREFVVRYVRDRVRMFTAGAEDFARLDIEALKSVFVCRG